MHFSHWLSSFSQEMFGGSGRQLRRRTSQRPGASASKMMEQLEGRQLLTTIDLATLTAAEGTAIFGVDPNDHSGYSVSSAGDVNGDGFDDLLIAANSANA